MEMSAKRMTNLAEDWSWVLGARLKDAKAREEFGRECVELRERSRLPYTRYLAKSGPVVERMVGGEMVIEALKNG